MNSLDLASLLNPAQLTAATCPEGPICIVAGAGSGKTRVITHRLAFLVHQGLARPEQLLAVTFTNKAARELQDRVDGLLPGVGYRLWVSTFHSAAARIIREAHDVVGLPREFVIYDQDDAERLIAQVCGELNLLKDLTGTIQHRIEAIEHKGLLPDAYEPSTFEGLGKTVKQVYQIYWERLRAAGAVDFGGLIIHALNVLKQNPQASWSVARVTHAVVDEYQDVNPAQAALIEALFPRLKSLAVVGDDDQSIYRWRGASADSLLNFTHAFPSAKRVHLTENYRSTARILRLANEVIAGNPGRLGKELWTKAGEGTAIRLQGFTSERDEAGWVVEDCKRWLCGGGNAWDVGVLYRTNAQTRPLEEALHRAQVRYRILGGLRFYERREVKDLLAYLRLCANPRSEMDLRRIINVPARSIGQTTLKHLEVAAARARVGFTEALHLPDAELEAVGIRPQGRAALKEFATLMGELRKKCTTLTPTLAITEVLALTGYEASLRLEEDGEDRLENLQSLSNAAADFEQDMRAAGIAPTLDGFLERTSLQTDVSAEQGEDRNGITLMTLHAAKGLEFRRVYLVGVEEGVLPFARAVASRDPEDMCEERRLCYVGLTRAREQLVVTFCGRRMVNGDVRLQEVSRFLTELPPERVREDMQGDIHAILPAHRASTMSGGYGQRRFDPNPTRRVDRGDTSVVYDDDAGAGSWRNQTAENVRRPMRMTTDVFDLDLDSVDVLGAEEEEFCRGMRVRNVQYGVGTVLTCAGSGPQARVEVEFPDIGVRKIVARYLSRV